MTDKPLIVQDNQVGEAVRKIQDEFFFMDEEQSKRFVQHFGSRKAKHPMSKDRLVKTVQNTVYLNEDTQYIEAGMLIFAINPEDQPLAEDIAKFVGEYISNNPSQFKATRLTVAQYRAMLIRRMFQAGFTV